MAKSELIGIRVSKDEMLDLWTAALDANTSLSTFIREAALERARQPLEPADAFVSDDPQVNKVQTKILIPRRRSVDP